MNAYARGGLLPGTLPKHAVWLPHDAYDDLPQEPAEPEPIVVPLEVADRLHDVIYLEQREKWVEGGARPDYLARFTRQVHATMTVGGARLFNAYVRAQGRAVCNCSLGFHITVDDWEVATERIECDVWNE